MTRRSQILLWIVQVIATAVAIAVGVPRWDSLGLLLFLTVTTYVVFRRS